MVEVNREKLLKNRQVVEEINRHLWIESEKAGYNIGFEKATDDWMDKFAASWVKFHMPGNTFQPQQSAKKKSKKSK